MWLMRASLALAVLLALSLDASAHRRWLMPSATVLAGDDPWVTIDAASSNDLFYFEHRPLPLDNLVVTAPDGTAGEVANRATGKFRSSFDLRLSQPGTWRIAIVTDVVVASWRENGGRKQWRGAAAAFATSVPSEAAELRVSELRGRLESYITRGKPSLGALQSSGRGLEVQPGTHPNDLVAGDAAAFVLLLDGKPAAGVKVEVVAGGIRYRDQLGDFAVTTGEDGEFTITWPAPGMFWINAEVQDDASSIKGAKRRSTYTATLEVLPR